MIIFEDFESSTATLKLDNEQLATPDREVKENDNKE